MFEIFVASRLEGGSLSTFIQRYETRAQAVEAMWYLNSLNKGKSATEAFPLFEFESDK